MEHESIPRLSLEMLPAIRANVRAKKIWVAAGWLLLWGVVNLLVYLADRDMRKKLLGEISNPSVFLYILLYGVGVIAWFMIISSVFGIATGHPYTILMDGLVIVFVGAWNVLHPFLLAIALKEHGYRLEGYYVNIIGIAQIFCGLRELRRYQFIRAWASEIAGTTIEHRTQVKKLLKAFVKLDEDHAQQRLRAVYRDRSFLSFGVTKGMRGMILDDDVILVSKRLDDCFCFTRAECGVGKYNDRGMAKIRTAEGTRQFTFGPVSALLFKSWAGIEIFPKEVRRLVKAKKATVAALRPLLERPEAVLRVEAAQALKAVKETEEGVLAALECLTDEDGGVRAAALGSLREMKADGLHDRVVPLLKDAEARVRAAAAAYLAAHGMASAMQPLSEALQVEQDSKARSQLTKALKTCQQAGANPYAVQ